MFSSAQLELRPYFEARLAQTFPVAIRSTALLSALAPPALVLSVPEQTDHAQDVAARLLHVRLKNFELERAQLEAARPVDTYRLEFVPRFVAAELLMR